MTDIPQQISPEVHEDYAKTPLWAFCRKHGIPLAIEMGATPKEVYDQLTASQWKVWQ